MILLQKQCTLPNVDRLKALSMWSVLGATVKL